MFFNIVLVYLFILFFVAGGELVGRSDVDSFTLTL